MQGHSKFGSVVSGGVIGRTPCGMLCENMEVSSFVPHIIRLWAGLKVVTIEIIQIVTTIIVTTFKRCNNLNML